MEELGNGLETKEVVATLFLSRTCPHCKKLITEFSEEIFDLGIRTLYTEDANFRTEYTKVYDWFRKHQPELTQYEYITPVLALFDNEGLVIQAYAGYLTSKLVLEDLSKKMRENKSE